MNKVVGCSLLSVLSIVVPVTANAEDAAPPAPGITTEMIDMMDQLPGEIGALGKVTIPFNNHQTPEKVELGKMLYFDNQLSGDHSMSCATCHAPDKGFSDNHPLTIGFGKQELGRHSPTVLNTAYNSVQFWDGRAGTLEQQAAGPIMAAGEMNMSSEEELVKRLSAASEYEGRFEEVFREGPSLSNVAKAIAAYERTIVSRNSPFDKYAAGDKSALTETEKRGLILFIGKASCTQCHSGANFTDNGFHNLGVPQMGPAKEDVGRYAVTKDDADMGAFKTPTLRNIAQSAPYMHCGSHDTLREVVEFYNEGGGDHANKSDKMFELNLTDTEIDDLVAFLESLTGPVEGFENTRIAEVNNTRQTSDVSGD